MKRIIKRYLFKISSVVLAALIAATAVPFGVSDVFAETLPNYSFAKAIDYAAKHFDDGGTVLNPTKEDCVQFVRECLETGGVPKDTNRNGADGKPYGYKPDDYAEYLTSRGYAIAYELKTEKQNWSKPQWYVKASDNKGVLSLGDAIAHYCPKCDTFFHITLAGEADSKGFVTYYGQNPAAKSLPVCTIGCSHCGNSYENTNVYSLHITSSLNGFSGEYNNRAVSGLNAVNAGNGNISLKWNGFSDAQGYRVFVKHGLYKPYKFVADVKVNSCTYSKSDSVVDCYFAVMPYFSINGKVHTGKMCDAVLYDENVTEKKDITRIAGSNRYKTAIETAEAFRNQLGLEKFENIVVAGGSDYPDALSGSCLANAKKAPILLVDRGEESMVAGYLNSKLAANGKVFILGGEGAVSRSFENMLNTRYITRLGGRNRYETNLKILKYIGVKTGELLVCSGAGFADSISASASGKPLLMADNIILPEQKEFLQGKNFVYTIIGGNGAVVPYVENQLKSLGTVKQRLGGANRYETSVKIAKALINNTGKSVILASGKDFPDGLVAGVIGYYTGAPMILVDKYDEAYAKAYGSSIGIKKVTVMGGPRFVTDSIAESIIQ